MNRLSVIIPTFNRNEMLAACLEKLAPGCQTLSPTHYEVIVSDDGKHEESRDLVQNRFPWARWIKGPQRGPAANRNNGARAASAEWLVFLDDDCLPDENLLRSYATYSGEAMVLEGRIYADRQKQRLDEEAPLNEGGNLWSCNFAIKRELFRGMGGFDENFPFAAMEDVDLHLRLRKAGEKIEYLPDAAVCHPWRTARGLKSWRKHLSSTLYYLQKHPDQRVKISFYNYIRIAASVLRHEIIGGYRYGYRGLVSSVTKFYHFITGAVRLLYENSKS